MRSPTIPCVFMLVALVAVVSGCSVPSRVQTPPVASVSTTVVDRSAPLSTEDSETLTLHGKWRWNGPVPESLNDVQSLLARAPWAIYPTQTFGHRLIGIFYVKGVPGLEKWEPRADYAILVYQGGIVVEAARHQGAGIPTVTAIFHHVNSGEQGGGEIVQVGPFPAISNEDVGGPGVGPGAASVAWIADDVMYSVEGGHSNYPHDPRNPPRPSSLPLADLLVLARSAVRAPQRITPDPEARPDDVSAALLRSLEVSGGRVLPDNFAALGLFINPLWPKDTLGRRLVAIVYNRIPARFPPRFTVQVGASGRGPVTTQWYPRLTLIYEDGLIVSEELDEGRFEGVALKPEFSVKRPTDALGIPGYVGRGRLEFMPHQVRYTVDAPQFDRKQLEQVGRSMLQ